LRIRGTREEPGLRVIPDRIKGHPALLVGAHTSTIAEDHSRQDGRLGRSQTKVVVRHIRLISAIAVSLLALGVVLCISSVPFGAAATTVSGGHGLTNDGGSVRITAYSNNDGSS